MAKKIIKSLSALVYSTDPDFKIEENQTEEQIHIPTNQQTIRVKLEKKHRGGKVVTLIEGFIGTNTDKENLGKNLKTFCGTGGAVKDDEILIQGDNRDKVVQWFVKNGYTNTKRYKILKISAYIILINHLTKKEKILN
ncbi:MAG: translation initiation factor [Chitinophagaceae bacterium]|nr:translation initiation factor [Chitinophagaceae bacterium]